MKLINKNILVNALLSVGILFTGEFSLYLLLKTKIEKETIEHLNLERRFLMKKLKKGIDVISFNQNIGDAISVNQIPVIQYKDPIIENLEVEEEWEEEHFSSKKIIFDVEQNAKFYRVSITKTIDEDEDFTTGMWLIIFVSGVSILLILILVNIVIHKKIFAPIYKLNKEINDFSVKQLNKIDPPKTSTLEFKALGESISYMSEKIIHDYNAMKEFTENIAHEIQTPLAVINAKIERSLQHPDLSKEQAILLTDASRATNKLFNISKGLSLLSRLDNGQYTNTQKINLIEFIEKRIEFFSDFIENKNIKLTKNFQSEIEVNVDVVLCEVLIDNLLKNAIKHNFENGQIIVTTKGQQLVISNTGEKPTEELTNYFKRFYSKSTNDSLGLGLSIIKKIAEYYHFAISYEFNDNLHVITITCNATNK